jgi:hypothetical protein
MVSRGFAIAFVLCFSSLACAATYTVTFPTPLQTFAAASDGAYFAYSAYSTIYLHIFNADSVSAEQYTIGE